MQQRPFRLGDIVDDYCPRERRITNHAVVAIIDDQVRQTRCTTCDAEHVYKAGRVPSRRVRKETLGVLHKQLPEVMHDESEEPVGDVGASAASEPIVELVAADASPIETHAIDGSEPEKEPVADEGPVHRPLIRATLPRHEGQQTARPVPEFTIRQSGGRSGAFRNNGPRLMHQGDRQRGNGGRPPGQGGGQRFAGSRPAKPGRAGVERSSRFSQRSERTQPHVRDNRSGHPNRSEKKRSR